MVQKQGYSNDFSQGREACSFRRKFMIEQQPAATTAPVVEPPVKQPKRAPVYIPEQQPRPIHQPAPQKEPSPFDLPNWAKPGQEPDPKAVHYANS